MGPPPGEVPLPDAPLVRVLAQVRFPAVYSIEKPEFIAALQEAVRHEFPVLRPEHAVQITPDQGPRAGTTWRFQDAGGAWKLTLASDFMALDTTAYVSRNDFLERWTRAIGVLREHVNPGLLDRVGLRYVDRLTGADLQEVLTSLVRPELVGVLSTPLAERVRYSVSENLFELPEKQGQLRARWGWVPPKSTVDPTTIEPIDEASWLLDLDAFQTDSRPFDPDAVIVTTRAFAERIYSFFRWAITPRFLERYGGEP